MIINSPDSPGNLAAIVSTAAQFEMRVFEVRHVRGTGEIKWQVMDHWINIFRSDVSISVSFYSNSFKHQLMFLNALVEQGRFPTIVGR